MPENMNTQSRKWMITINNPQTCGLDHHRILELLQLFRPDYFCLSDEIASTGTYHTHIFLYSHSPMRFGTVKRRFPPAHIDKANGTAQENRDYIRKEGKWAETAKAETRVDGSFVEFGSMPTPAEESAPKMFQLLQDVTDGFTTVEIIKNNPGFAFKGRDIDSLRESLQSEQYRTESRELKVHYLYGDTGTGKTRGIFAKHPAAEICRLTDYGGRTGLRFDAYHGQKVLVFEEFHSQVPIEAMLNYLDVYPLMLPARYNDRVACYTVVYITSNIPLDEQYQDIQRYKLETWRAFLRRINTVTEYRRGLPPREVPHDER